MDTFHVHEYTRIQKLYDYKRHIKKYTTNMSFHDVDPLQYS